MNLLKEIVNQLNKEDVRLYKIYASRTSDSPNRKDLILFDLYRKSPEVNDDEFFKKLYSNADNKNVYHRLKNRIIEDLNKSLFLNNLDNEDIEVHYNICIYRYYYSKNLYRLAAYYLKRAEKLAIALDNFELIDIIFSEFIKLSSYIQDINPEEILNQKASNDKKLYLHRKIEELLAIINYKLRITQNLSLSDDSNITALQKLISTSVNDPEITENRTFRFKIYNALSRIYILKREFKNLVSYIEKTFSEFEMAGMFTRSHHEDKLSMLIHLMNALNMDKQHQKAIETSDRLFAALQEFDGFLFHKYAFFYYAGLVNSYGELKMPRKAIEVLNEMEDKKVTAHNSTYEVFTMLNLAICKYELGDLHGAIKQINRLYISDSFNNLDISVKFKIEIAELMMRFEKEDWDSFSYKLGIINKDYIKGKLPVNQREVEVLELLNRMASDPHYKKNVEIRNLAAKLIEEDVAKTEYDLIDYKDWLRDRFK
jgi:pentatricopeptide repeat protein